MADRRAIRDGLDRIILRRMAEACVVSRWHPPGYFAAHLRALTCDVIDKDIARAICRSLTDRGLASYMRGLWTEDGEPAGAGYHMTWKGWRYLAALDDLEA